MKKGFLLGKFLPLHTGHLALIDFARKHCDHLSVIICASSKENIDGRVRKQWLKDAMRKDENISLILFLYEEKDLPNTSESSHAVSEKWAEALKPIVHDAEIVFTSESYGDYLAKYMNIQHLLFDQARNNVPVSSSLIRENPLRYWDFIADSAKTYYVKKIAVVGTESTGKSILAEKLSAHFHTSFVPEMAREIIEKTGECTYEHLGLIAKLHAKKIIDELSAANKLPFLDTDINITESYSRFLFNRELVVDPWIKEANRSDLYLFLEPDCTFVQDGTRLDEKERNRLSLFHKKQLEENNINFTSIGGNWDARFNTAVDIIQKKYFA